MPRMPQVRTDAVVRVYGATGRSSRWKRHLDGRYAVVRAGNDSAGNFEDSSRQSCHFLHARDRCRYRCNPDLFQIQGSPGQRRIYAPAGDIPLRLYEARARRNRRFILRPESTDLFFVCDRSDRLAADLDPLYCIVLPQPWLPQGPCPLVCVLYFDIYGCGFAILALLVPANAAYPLIMTVGCAILLLIHHLHLFIYIPTIGFIFIVRYYLLSQVTLFRILLGAAAMTLTLGIFMVVLLANAPVPPETLFYYIAARALDPFEAGVLRIWYSNAGDEMRRTWSAMPTFALRIPIYVALIALHIPLIRFFKQIVGFLGVRRARGMVLLGLAAITAAYAM